MSASGRCFVTADTYAFDMSIATASMRAPDDFKLFQKGARAFESLPFPTYTTAPLVKSSTIVR